jgi:pimeloyl-ACP methyl ester carboxylesterase
MDIFYRKSGQGKPLIILHGLYGSSDNWISFAKYLSGRFVVYLPDQRNHGRSFHAQEHNYDVLSNDLLQFIKHHNIKYPVIAGHSMGGKAAMAFALKYPALLSSLIVLDISPNPDIQSPAFLQYFKFHQSVLAALKSIDLAGIRNHTDAKAKIKHLLNDPELSAFLLKNLAKDQHGAFFWKINIDAFEKGLKFIMGRLIDQIDHSNLDPVTIPTLFLKGENSEYLQKAEMADIQRFFSNSSLKTIQNAGHWLHVDAPEELSKTIISFTS